MSRHPFKTRITTTGKLVTLFPPLQIGLFISLLLTGLLTGCDPADGDLDEADPESLYFEPIGSGFYTAFRDTTEMVIRTEEEWLDIRDQLQPREPIREVDFSQVMLLVVSIPVEESGYQIEFSAVEREEGQVRAYYRLLEPGTGCMAAAVEATPFEVAAVRRAEDPVTFVRERRRYRCEMRL